MMKDLTIQRNKIHNFHHHAASCRILEYVSPSPSRHYILHSKKICFDPPVVQLLLRPPNQSPSNQAQPHHLLHKIMIHLISVPPKLRIEIASSHPTNIMNSSPWRAFQAGKLCPAGDAAVARRISGIVTAPVGETAEFFTGQALVVRATSISFPIGKPCAQPNSWHAAVTTSRSFGWPGF